VTSINGPFDPTGLPIASAQVDYEAELVVIVGKRCKHVTRIAQPTLYLGIAPATTSRCAIGRCKLRNVCSVRLDCDGLRHLRNWNRATGLYERRKIALMLRREM
jgi:hypothetical protein